MQYSIKQWPHSALQGLKGMAVCLLISQPATAESLWQLDGFDQPESMIVDTAHQRIVVSNMLGDAAAKDGAGYLSTLSMDGEIMDKHWLQGLNAPKGMAIVGTQLLVADIEQLRVIDLDTAELSATIDVPDAVFLNDISSDGDVAYISDFAQQAIYRYQDGKVERWLQQEGLQYPNGLLLEEQRLLVASWGTGLREDYSTEVPGSLLAVDLNSREISFIAGAEKLGNLDGLAKTAGGYVVNDWITGEVFYLDQQGQLSNSEQSRAGLADISVHQGIMYRPFMLEGSVEAQSTD